MLKGFIVLAALSAVLTSAGCGGSGRLSKPEYLARLHAVNVRVGRAEGAAEAAFAPGGSPSRGRHAILEWANAEQQAGEELAAVRPPKDAEAVNRNLSNAEKQFAAALRKAAGALEGAPAADGPKILERQMRSSPAPSKLDQAIAQLKALGYSRD